MKNKEIAAILGLSVSLATTGCGSNITTVTTVEEPTTQNESVQTPQINQIKDMVQVELGDDVSIVVDDYFEKVGEVKDADIKIDTSMVDTNKIGEYVASVTYTDNSYEIKVSVVDTTAPKISVKKSITGNDFGTTIKPDDYVEYEDKSDVSLYIVTESGDETELEVPADLDMSVTEINYTVVAVDSEGNRSEEISVTIPIEHNFTYETVEKEDGKTKYSDDEFTCETCGFEYVESPLDEEINPPYHFENDKNYEIEPMDDTTMYATQACNVRSGPATTYDKIDSLNMDQEVTVIGKVTKDGKTWYVIKSDDTEKDHMVSGSLISTEKIATKKPSSGNTKPSSGNTATVTPAPQPSDCVADCDWGDCEGFCDFTDCEGWSDCETSYCSASYCAQAE